MIRMQSLTNEKYNQKLNNNQINEDYIYFITDTKQIYKGTILYNSNSDLYETINQNLKDNLIAIQDKITPIIKNVHITLQDSLSLSDNFVTTKNDVNYYINGNNANLTINNNFNFSGNYNEFNNIVFNVNELSGGITAITKNTCFNNCKFNLTNSRAFTITLDVGCSVQFNNCIFVGTDVLSIINEATQGFRLTSITNCIVPGNVIINSSNPDEIVNITYTKGINIIKDDNNEAIVYDMKDPIFDTIETIGG